LAPASPPDIGEDLSIPPRNLELNEEEIASKTLQAYLRSCEFVNKEAIIAIS